ncbi:MAG TPA: DUF1851 domain-containing protein [Terracidiphilus sp.]|nr:DUF1851 domain-containing protein [Terracidiphilus sp.]
MDVNDYLIDQTDKDWNALLEDWVEVLPSTFTIWFVNRIGDLILAFEDGSIHLLDVGHGTIEKIAESREQFCELIDAGDNAEDWLMISLVDECRAAGITISANQCYGFKIPPLLSGKYEVSNIAPIDLAEHYSFLADIFQQTKNFPNGTKLKLVIKNKPAG